ncbi:MAG: acireductone synthase [Acidobacteriota bacterium]
MQRPGPNWHTIVLDIEGTTTPIAFVYEVLFPFVRRRLRGYLLDPRSRGALDEPLRLLRDEWAALADRAREGPPWLVPPMPGSPPRDEESLGPADSRHVEYPESLAAYIEGLMDEDRKSHGLKLLQGRMWEEGYRSGELNGDVFADVAPALRRWRDAGAAVAIYSSGSELAQRLLFGTTAFGDLTPLIARFFDTAVGAKQAAQSYHRIARELGVLPDQMLYISDVTTELDAAREAGCQVRLCIRPGNRPQPRHSYSVIQSFAEVP